MRYTNIIYNEKFDQNKVVAGRSINIREAFETGIIKSTGKNDDFNEIDDPVNIGSRVEDEFDAINRSRQIQESNHKSKNNVSTPKGAESAQTTETA